MPWLRSSTFTPDKRWNRWSSELEKLINSNYLDLFPSLEHVNVNVSLGASSTLVNYPSLRCLTRNISTLRILRGCLSLESDDEKPKTTWPHLGGVHFQTLPDGTEECRKLVAGMAERGRRSSGTFSVILPAQQLERLEKMKKTGALKQELQDMKAVVRLETASVMYGETWPPKGGVL